MYVTFPRAASACCYRAPTNRGLSWPSIWKRRMKVCVARSYRSSFTRRSNRMAIGCTAAPSPMNSAKKNSKHFCRKARPPACLANTSQSEHHADHENRDDRGNGQRNQYLHEPNHDALDETDFKKSH